MQIDFLPCCQCNDEIVYIVHDSILHLIEGVIFFSVDDSADVVFTEVYLAVVCGLGISCFCAVQVKKMGHDGSSTKVYGNGKICAAPFARLDIYKLRSSASPANSSSYVVIICEKDLRESLQYPEAGLHYGGVDLLSNRNIQALVVCGMVVNSGFRHLNIEFLNQRVKLKDAFSYFTGKLAEPVGIGVHKYLTCFDGVELRDRYCHIGKDFGLAGKHDIFTGLFRCK